MCLFAWGNKKLQSNIINLFFYFKMSSVSKFRVLELVKRRGKTVEKQENETIHTYRSHYLRPQCMNRSLALYFINGPGYWFPTHLGPA